MITQKRITSCATWKRMMGGVLILLGGYAPLTAGGKPDMSTQHMYIQLAPIRLKKGIDERRLLKASDDFQVGFVNKQKGIMKRILIKGKDGNYADLVFFESKDAADRVAEAEQNSPACFAYFELMEEDKNQPEMGVLSFEHIKTYE